MSTISCSIVSSFAINSVYLIIRLLLLAPIILLVPEIAMCGELPVKIQTPERFTIRLPDGWIPMTQASINEQYMARKRLVPPGVIFRKPDYGFMSPESHEGASIMITVWKTGRIEKDTLEKNYELLKAGASQGVNDVASLAPLITDAAIHENRYDPLHHIIWIQTQMKVEGYGVIKMISGHKLTRDGFIAICCGALEKEFDILRRQYIEIIIGLEVAPEIDY